MSIELSPAWRPRSSVVFRFTHRSFVAAALLSTAAACTSLPPTRGYSETSALVAARVDAAPAAVAAPTGAAAEVPHEPIDAQHAVRLAFAHSPRVAEAYARIGMSRAELESARRLGNPSLGYTRLEAPGAPGAQVSQRLTTSLSELVLLPSRVDFAAAALEQMQLRVAGEVLALATEVEVAWECYVGAQQIAGTRTLAARAAEQSALLAQRFFDAGNITRLQLARERAAAAVARVELLRADAATLHARAELALLMGLPSAAAWTTAEQPATSTTSIAAEQQEPLVALALTQRPDLAAARREVELRGDALALTRRWRWLGRVEVGYEREDELPSGVIRGPSLSIELPIFNQGQDAIARGESRLREAQARLAALTAQIESEVRLGLQSLRIAGAVADRYRTELVPEREAIEARSQEEVNFMLMGVFELLSAKQAEHDAYQGYLEAVRELRIERVRLRGAVGGRLPDERIATLPAATTHESPPPAHQHATGESR